MTAIVFEGEPITLDEGETVLDGLLRLGHNIPHGCRSGVCQSCLLSATETDKLAAAQTGLSEAQKQLNFFLGCQCLPAEAMTVARVDASKSRIQATVIEKTQLNDQVWRLRLTADLDYRPGQYVTLWRDESLARSYSLASTHEQPWLEFHIRHYPDGEFSSWIVESLQQSDTLELNGPLGQFFYTAQADDPLLMIAMGTGLAPIWGIVNEALLKQHRGPIHVLIGAKQAKDFYYRKELEALQEKFSNLHLNWSSLDSDTPETANLYDFCQSTFPQLSDHKVFLCGGTNFVKKLRRYAFMAGAAMKDIHADTFIVFGGETG